MLGEAVGGDLLEVVIGDHVLLGHLPVRRNVGVLDRLIDPVRRCGRGQGARTLDRGRYADVEAVHLAAVDVLHLSQVIVLRVVARWKAHRERLQGNHITEVIVRHLDRIARVGIGGGVGAR